MLLPINPICFNMKAEFGNLEQIKLLQQEQRNKDIEAEIKKRKRYESPMEEFIDLESSLGWHYFAISMIVDELNKNKPKSAIDVMIDTVTGYAQGVTTDASKLAMQHLKAIIKFKKKLNNKFGREHTWDNDLTTIASLTPIVKSVLKKKK